MTTECLNPNERNCADARRLPDRPKPWASGIRQANLIHLLPKIMCNSLTYYFEHGGEIARVQQQNYLGLSEIISFRFA